MTKRIQVCENCGHKQEVVFLTGDEARARGVMTGQPCCEKCQSFKVKIK